MDRLSLALARRVRRPEQSCGVLFIDLDRFKEINDVLGHAAGDVVLMAVAERLHAVLRPQDSAARLGGDEFAVLVENIVSASDLETVAKRVLHGDGAAFRDLWASSAGRRQHRRGDGGPDHTSSDLLIRDADFAMYRAKQSGGGRYEIFDKHLEVVVTSQQERERELRYRLDKRLFEFRYQPIFRLHDGKLEGFECAVALAPGRRIGRQLWRPAGGGRGYRAFHHAGPGDDGGRVLAAAELAQRVAAGGPHPDRQPDAPAVLPSRHDCAIEEDACGQRRRSFAALFEVPESALNENPDAAVAILQRMVDCNVRVAMDDFGSSLAPLNHLVRLPIDMVKLDPKLTAAATSAGRQQAVLESLIRLGRTLGPAGGGAGN